MKITSWYRIQNSAAETADVYLYDSIGDYGTSAKEFVNELRTIAAKTINLHINSPGGEVSASMAIYNSLRAHPARVIAHVDGMAASGASVIAMAGDEIRVASNALVMIHEANGVTLGGSDDHAKMIEILDRMNDQIAGVYASRARGKTKAQWREAMKAESWFNADEAKAAGLADVVVDYSEGIKAAASFDLSKFRHVPPALAKLTAKADRPTMSYADADAQARKEWSANRDGCQGRFSEAGYIGWRRAELMGRVNPVGEGRRTRINDGDARALAAREWDDAGGIGGFSSRDSYLGFRQLELQGRVIVSRPASVATFPNTK